MKWGDWGWAARVQLAYTHPRTDAFTTIEELVRVTDPDGWKLRRRRPRALLGRAAERAAAASGVRLRLGSSSARHKAAPSSGTSLG